MAYRDERDTGRGRDDVGRYADDWSRGRREDRRDWGFGGMSPGMFGYPALLPYEVVPYPGGINYGSHAGAYGMGRPRGRYAGRGPKGYRRPDGRIREDVNERLTMHPEVDATDVEVEVQSGVVLLNGIVEDRAQKRLAEDIAEDVFGVLDIDNNLKVRHGFLATLTGEKATEREIARATERDEHEPDSVVRTRR